MNEKTEIKTFIKKSLIVTLCIGVLLYLFVPRYEFFDKTHRGDRISGKSEYYFSYAGTRKWREE